MSDARSTLDRHAVVKGPLEDGVLRFRSLRGAEQVSRVYRYTLDVTSDDGSIRFGQLAGADVGVLFSCDDQERFIGGVCVGFERSQRHRSSADDPIHEYRLTLVPWFALLQEVTDNRALEYGNGDTVQTVFDTVVNEQSVSTTVGATIARGWGHWGSRFTWKAAAGPTRPLYVQYRETDHDFLSRLLERDGVSYFFDHQVDPGVSMILTDAHAQHPAGPTVPLHHVEIEGGDDVERVSKLRACERMRAAEQALVTYDWTDTTGAPVMAVKPAPEAASTIPETTTYDVAPDVATHASAQALQDAADWQATGDHAGDVLIRADCNSIELRPGHTVDLEDEAHEAMGTYLVLETELVAEADPADGGRDGLVRCPVFHCQFTAMPTERPLRPERRTPVPTVAGPQTATVVGNADNEVTADAPIQVKVRFHWDVRNADDAHAVWVRVAQPLAGAGWGGHFVPRQGMEVVVEFVDGQVDQPLVTGTVHNGVNGPAFPMPDSANIIGLRSRSTTDGNEETFSMVSIDDTMEAEMMEVVAERDFKREVGNDDVLEVGLVHQDPGDQTVTIYNNRSVTINQGDDTLTIETGGRTTTIEADETRTITGSRTTTIETDEKLDVTGNVDVFGKVITIAADDELVLQCGSAKITLKSDGAITIDGGAVEVKGSKSMDVTTNGSLLTKGQSATVEGTSASLKGSTVKIEGSMVKIN